MVAPQYQRRDIRETLVEVKRPRHAEGQQTEHDLLGGNGKHLTGDTTSRWRWITAAIPQALSRKASTWYELKRLFVFICLTVLCYIFTLAKVSRCHPKQIDALLNVQLSCLCRKGIWFCTAETDFLTSPNTGWTDVGYKTITLSAGWFIPICGSIVAECWTDWQHKDWTSTKPGEVLISNTSAK